LKGRWVKTTSVDSLRSRNDSSTRVSTSSGWGVLPHERIGEAGGRVDVAELSGEIEGIALGRLHLDPVAASPAWVEVEAREGEAIRPPPFRQLIRIAEQTEHGRRSGRKDALYLEGEPAR
jgi:hypothetical protein